MENPKKSTGPIELLHIGGRWVNNKPNLLNFRKFQCDYSLVVPFHLR